MKVYNPKVEGHRITDCLCYNRTVRWCNAENFACPTEDDPPAIPTDCPARGEGILIKVKE
jgi:hypothetical protein